MLHVCSNSYSHAKAVMLFGVSAKPLFQRAVITSRISSVLKIQDDMRKLPAFSREISKLITIYNSPDISLNFTKEIREK